MPFLTVACVEEEPYQKGEADLAGCYGVYFPVQEAAGAHTYDPTMPTEVTFTVARTKTTDAISVPITVTESHEGIFNVPNAEFADGQTETTVKVTFPNSENGVNYKLSLAIEDPQYASKYLNANTHMDFSVLRVEWLYVLNPQTNQPAKFTFNQGWWEEVHTGYVKYYEVNGVRTCITETDPVVTENGTAYGFWGTGEAAGEGELSFTWYTNVIDGNGKQAVALPESPVYFNTNYGAVVHAYDWYTYFTVVNPQAALAGVDFPAFVAKYGANYPTSYYDNGGFYFFVAYYYMIGIGGWGIEDYDVVCEAEGYTRVDYTMDVESDYCDAGVVPVFFEVGADIKTVNYVVAAGKVNSVDMAELLPKVADGTAENVVKVSESDMTETETGKEFALGVVCPATGEYTLVAVGLDADGNAQANTSVVFDYVAADDDTQNVDFNVFVEATHERYAAEGLTEFNSFAYTIYGGNGATAVHVGVYDSATVEKYGEAVVISDVRSSDYALDEESLAAVNSVAGYSDIVSGLKDGVSYTLVVWATNGVLTKSEFVEFTTTKNPEVFKSLGMGLYTEDFLYGLFNGLENVTYEVEVEESVDNPGKYRLVNPDGAAYPFNAEGDYDASQNYYMVINAQDPEGVYIPLQGVGCDWGYGEWTVYSMAARYLDNGNPLEAIKGAGYCGTLKDGVITFPVKSLLITAEGLGGNLYYANTMGAFKVVLPGYADAIPEGGVQTASVNKSSVNTVESAFDRPMTSGYFTGIDYTENIVTVSCETVPSQTVKKSSSRYSSIEKISALELK